MIKSSFLAILLLISAAPVFAAALPFCTVRVNVSVPSPDWRHSVGSADVYLGADQYEHFEGPDHNWVGAYIGDRYYKEARRLAVQLDRDHRCSYREPWWVFSSDGAAALAAYVGRHTVASRECRDGDTICANTVAVVLTPVEGGSYRLEEVDAAGQTTLRLLEENIAFPRSSVFRAITGEDYWCRYDVDAAGKILRADSVTFTQDWRTHELGFESRVTTTMPDGHDEYYLRSYKFSN